MLDQIKLLNSAEALICVMSNKMTGALPVIDFRQIQEAQEGGSYSDTCLLTVPANHSDAQYVIRGNYLLFQDLDGLWQEYRIVDVQRTDSMDGSTITATGEHAFYELLGEPINDIRPTSTTATAAVIQALTGTRWSIGTGDSLGDNSCRIYKTSVLSALSTIAKTWGGELRFWIQVTGNVISGRRVDILSQRGTVTNKRFEFRKDLVSVTQTVNMQNLATALIGRGKGVEVDGGSATEDPAYGRRLEFDEIAWATGDGDPADKPLGQNWIGDDTAASAYGPGGRHIFSFVQYDDCTDAEELLTLTYNELQVRKAPQTTYELSAVVLEELSGYSHEAVRLGDTVRIINAAVSPVSTGEARVIYIDRSLTDPTSCQLIIGNYIPTLSDSTVQIQQAQQSILDRSGVWDRSNAITPDDSGLGGDLEYKIDLLKTQLSSTASHFYTDENGNMIFENTAGTKALKLGAGIFALANSKTGSDWNWRTFGDGDGFTADEISAGTLNAAIVFAGELYGAIGTFTNLIAGVTGAQRMDMGYDSSNDPYIKVYDNSNNLKLTLTKNGLMFSTNTRFVDFTIGDKSGVGVFID